MSVNVGKAASVATKDAYGGTNKAPEYWRPSSTPQYTRAPLESCTTNGLFKIAVLPADTSIVYVDVDVAASVLTKNILCVHASVAPSVFNMWPPCAVLSAHPVPACTCAPQLFAEHANEEGNVITTASDAAPRVKISTPPTPVPVVPEIGVRPPEYCRVSLTAAASMPHITRAPTEL